MKNSILSEEQIQFIDNYLQKSEVIFVDVRAEMMDHIATAIEEKMQSKNIEFYDAFKDFMVFNKKELLKRNKKMFSYFQDAILSFSKTLFKSYNIVFGILLILFSFFFDYSNYLKTINYGIFFGVLIIGMIQNIYFRLILRKRYLFIENTSTVLMTIYFFTMFFNGAFGDFYGNSISIGITLFLLFAFVLYSVAIIKKFRLRYL